MARTPQLVDPYGRPVQRRVLREEIAAARVGTVRSPISGDPANGLDPVRLAQILKSADQGDPIQQMELCEIAEERNLHYLGVIGTRKRSVSQITVRVKRLSDDAAHEQQSEELEAWINRLELQGELFDILDAIGKGWSFTEIIWDTSMGQWQPLRLEWRDPRWFRPATEDLTTPMMIGDNGQPEPLPPFKFINACIKAKSGLPLRSGLGRIALWNWLFKSYTEKDWAIFSQTYGQPLRVGKWGAGATEDDKATLFNAVANIAGDCAAIIPESMMIEFVETGQLSATGQLYRDRVDYLDRQISKAVLGQTATTDADTGGLGSGTEHRQVQEDIERADAQALSAILNRDLVVPFIQLNHGPQSVYPQIILEDEEQEDLALLTSSLGTLVPLGMRVKEAEVLSKFGLTPPEGDDRILGQNPKSDENDDQNRASDDAMAPQSVFKYPVNTLQQQIRGAAPDETQRPSARRSEPVGEITDLMIEGAQSDIDGIVATLEAMMADATSFEEVKLRIHEGFADLDVKTLEALLAMALAAAHGAGRAQVAEEDG